MHTDDPLSPCAACALTRREFIAQSALLTAVAAALAACGDGQIGAVAPTAPGAGVVGRTFRLADFPALATVGGIARVDGGQGTPVAVVRTGTASFSAFSLVCPHQGTTVDVVGGGFRCPNHGATFSAAGRWVGGQATTDLVGVPLTYDAAAGTITIGGAAAGPPQQPPASNVSLVVRVADFPALAAVGGVARVDGSSATPVGVGRTGASSFVAYALACTHQGTTVLANGAGWRCPNHGARFDASGNVTLGPAALPLARLAVAYDAAAGTLTITGTAAPAPVGGGDDDGDDP